MVVVRAHRNESGPDQVVCSFCIVFLQLDESEEVGAYRMEADVESIVVTQSPELR